MYARVIALPGPSEQNVSRSYMYISVCVCVYDGGASYPQNVVDASTISPPEEKSEDLRNSGFKKLRYVSLNECLIRTCLVESAQTGLFLCFCFFCKLFCERVPLADLSLPGLEQVLVKGRFHGRQDLHRAAAIASYSCHFVFLRHWCNHAGAFHMYSWV
jgi:hypothetical protein